MRLYYLTRDIFWLIVLLVIVGVLLIAPARALTSQPHLQSFHISIIP